MLIDGPLGFGVLQHQDRSGYELHVTFTEEFRALDLARQAQAFRDYVASLGQQIRQLAGEDSLLLLSDEVESTMEQLLEILRSKGNNVDQARRGMRALFPVLDADSPQFKRLRRRFFKLAH